MSAILVHIGCTGPYIDNPRPPAHMFDCIEQYKLFNDDNLYVLTDRANQGYFLERDYTNVYTHAIEDYHSPKISKFESLYNYGPREFWTVTFTRLMYIENFMRVRGIPHLFEFANDVLIYTNLIKYIDICHSTYPGLGITPCGPQHVLDGLMYIHSSGALAHMTLHWIKQLEQYGVNGFCARYGYDMANEMTMMHQYVTEWGGDTIDFLPIMPFGKYSTNFGKFNSIFDPATWGQYVGGSRTDSPGMKPQNHHIGVALNDNPSWDVIWAAEAVNGLYEPFLYHDGIITKINNLHIHSKNTKLYMSNRKGV